MQKIWGLLFAAVLGGCLILTAVSPWVGWSLPRGVSSYSHDIDVLYYGILAIVTFFFALTESLLVYNMIRFASTPERKAEYSHGNHRLEIFWTVVPGVILILLAIWQINVWAGIKYPSHMLDSIGTDDYLQLEVAARQWEYRMRYPSPERYAGWLADHAKAKDDYLKRLPEQLGDVYVVNDIHCVKGQKVLIHLKTRDVGHSIFLPNIRVKQDALPGRTIPVWFEATEANTRRDGDRWLDGYREDGQADKGSVFDLVCTQYCGSRHSMMRGKLYVHPTKDDFLAWLKSAGDEYRKAPAGDKVADAR